MNGDAAGTPSEQRSSRPETDKSTFVGLKRGFLLAAEPAPAAAEVDVIDPPAEDEARGTSTILSPRVATGYSYSLAGTHNSREEVGCCLICTEPLGNDPREVINICNALPRCLCLLHTRCYMNPQVPMNDQLRKCMICHKPADPQLVRQAVRARQGAVGVS